MKKILILGANSFLAESFARIALEKGYSLALAARNKDKLFSLVKDLRIRFPSQEIEALSLDITNFESHELFLSEFKTHGPYEGCFIAVGVMHDQRESMLNQKLSLEMINVNYSGVVSLINHIIKPLIEMKTKFLSVVTSVAGDRGRASNFIYGSSKAALNSYLEGLRSFYHKESILIQTIKLGPVDTPMNAGIENVPLMISASRAASLIWKAILRKKEVVYVPCIWFFIMTIIKHCPRIIFKRLKF
jgi:decaprenylphospho-beta-D-erythro-pentofuranosid-2-ulose 2-reductase